MTTADGRTAATPSRRRRAKLSRLARRLAVYAISFAGLVCVVVVVYLAVVLGIGHVPSSDQTTILAQRLALLESKLDEETSARK